MKQIELHTDRLMLKELSQEIYDIAFNELYKAQAMTLLGIKNDQDYTIEKEKYLSGLSTYNKKFLFFHLVDKKSNQLIGWCGFHTWFIDHQRAEIGYAINDEALKGKGLMTEALTKIINYGFTEMNLNRIEALIAPENIPSLKLVAKLNFQQEGLLKQHYFKNGRYEDSIIFALLKDQWRTN